MSQAKHTKACRQRGWARRGVGLIELLVALAISAALLTATAMAIDASFQAYAIAAESASTQTSTRLVTHRLMALVRTSTAHGPLAPDADAGVTLTGDTLESPFIEMFDADDRHLRVEYRAGTQELWVMELDGDGNAVNPQPMLGGVTAATIHCHRRRDQQGVWVLERASIDLTVEATADTTLALETGGSPPIRVIASTMPRKVND